MVNQLNRHRRPDISYTTVNLHHSKVRLLGGLVGIGIRILSIKILPESGDSEDPKQSMKTSAVRFNEARNELRGVT